MFPWAFQKAYGFKIQCVSQGKIREKNVIKKNKIKRLQIN